MKHITTFILLLFSLVGFSQVATTVSITWVDDGGGLSHTIDSTTYDTGQLIITQGASVDSITLASSIVSDTLAALTAYNAELATFNAYATRIATLQALKTADSIDKEYQLLLKTELITALDSLIAN